MRLTHPIRVGMSFGLTSGIITIAVADSLSDALGIHVSEESEGVHSPREVWISTLATFVAKVLMALTFVIPVIAFPLRTAVVVAVLWGAVALAVLSIDLGRRQGIDPKPLLLEHLGVNALVIAASHFVGLGISAIFSE